MVLGVVPRVGGDGPVGAREVFGATDGEEWQVGHSWPDEGFRISVQIVANLFPLEPRVDPYLDVCPQKSLCLA